MSLSPNHLLQPPEGSPAWVERKWGAFSWFRRGQSLVEFALALPILLMLIFGIIEFGRFLQTWLALENGARFAVRYAVTGAYDTAYCDEAGNALGVNFADIADQDAATGINCRIDLDHDNNAGTSEISDWEDRTNALQDWARLPSVRDVAIAGATGLAWNRDTAVSGNYNQYLTNGLDDPNWDDSNRGNPSLPGYFSITICSTRAFESSTPGYVDQFQLNNLDTKYYSGPEFDAARAEDFRYPVYCQLSELDASGGYQGAIGYMDDAGGPGDRVRVILTYRHRLITPFLSSWWPTLRISARREGLVEKFRTSRVTGLTVSQGTVPSLTPTPSQTVPATPTTTATETATPTLTTTPDCDDLVFDDNSDAANEALISQNQYIYVWMYNDSPFDAVLTGAETSWLNNWHALESGVPSADVRPTNAVRDYGWDGGGGYSRIYTIPTADRDMLSAPVVTWDDNFSIPVNSYWSGSFVERFLTNLYYKSFASGNPSSNFNYYYGSDFRTTIRYTLGGNTCTRTLTGLPGPVINPAVGNNAVTGFYVDAGATAVRSGVYRVYFNVYNAANEMVHYQSEGGAPWCIFGDSSGACARRIPWVGFWNGPDGSANNADDVRITNGTYRISIIAVDNASSRYSTRRMITLVVNNPTPTVSRTPTVTRTRANTRTFTPIPPSPTITPPLPTRTRTPVPPATMTLTRTATEDISVSRTPTVTRTRTQTPTKCGIEGGC